MVRESPLIENRSSLRRMAERWFVRRRLPWAIAALGVALVAPSLWSGWIADDHHLRLRLSDSDAFSEWSEQPLLNLFSFAPGDPETMRRMMDLGFWPWWTLPEMKAAFFRPVTVITHWFDHLVWPDSAWLMHAHNLLWFAALLWLVTVFYRRVMGVTWVAGLAALLFAIDDAHVIPVGWISNRSTVIAAVFCLLTLLAHDRWRRCGWRMGGVVGPILLAMSLLSKEAGIATCAYLFAFCLALDPETRLRKWFTLVPYALVVVVWRIVWSAMGYGISAGFLIYVDPLQEPLRYIDELILRLPLYLAAQFFLPPADLAAVAGFVGLTRIVWILCALIIGVIAVVMARNLRWNSNTLFWLVGTLLSLMPICAAFPGNRMLMFVGLGAFPLIAGFLHNLFEAPRSAGTAAKKSARFVGKALVVMHLVLAPLVTIVHSAMPLGPSFFWEGITPSVPQTMDLTGKTVVIVASPMPVLAIILPECRAMDGLSVPERTRALATYDSRSLLVRRTDEHTITVRPRDGFLGSPIDQLARSPRFPMLLGERVELVGMTAEVLSRTPDGRPLEVSFRFDVPLEDPSLHFIRWRDWQFVEFKPPPVGETVQLAATRRTSSS